jgi:uncharacterized protein (TIRG00374 family)
MRTRFDRKAIRRGLNIFFGLSIACFALVFVFTHSAETLKALRRIDVGFLLLALALAAGDVLGGGLRMWVLSRGLSTPLSYVDALRSSLSSIAMGAVTPSQAGGGPAMVFILYRSGLPLAEALSAGAMSFVVTILFFVGAAGAITVLGVSPSVGGTAIQHVFRYSVAAFMVLGICFIAFTTWPGLLRATLTRVLRFLSLFRRKHFLRPSGRAHRLLAAADDFHAANATYFRHRLPGLIAAIVITAAIFGFKCMIAWCIVRGLGVQAGLGEVTAIQILILLAVYFFPTPGGTGAAELGSAVLMAAIVPVELLPVYVVLWRVVLMYLAVIVGSAVMLRALGEDTLVAGREGYGSVEKKFAVSGD